MLKKIWKYLSSMQFAILLLLILIVSCAIGSFITQGQTFEWYKEAYSERAAALIIATHMDDLYHSPWFLVIAGFLIANLLLCNLIRAPQLFRRFKDEQKIDKALSESVTCSFHSVDKPGPVFAALSMPKPVKAEADGKKILFSSSNRIGLWGAWICHLGVVLLILGFGLGQMTHEDYSLYGVSGQSKQVGDTSYICSIDSFRVELRDDDTVSQYRADITVHDSLTGNSQAAEISVNHPASLFGYKYYQNSTGWAARVSVIKNGSLLQETVLCAGESLTVMDLPELILHFNALYPDYVFIDGRGPASASGALNNPAYLYTLYYKEQLLGMNVLMEGETITVDDYEFRFSEPQNYTILQIKRDRFTALAFAGGILTLLGIFLAFYLQPRKVWAVQENDGSWTVSGLSIKSSALFREQMEQAIQRSQNSNT